MGEGKERSRLTSVERKNIIILLVLTLGSLIYKSSPITLGVFFGGVIITLNFWLLRRIVEGGLRTKENRPVFAFSYFFKFAALVAAIFVLINFKVVNILGLVIGLSTVFISIALDGFIQVLKKK